MVYICGVKSLNPKELEQARRQGYYSAELMEAMHDAKKKEDAHHLLEALWLHQQHNVRNHELLTAVLGSPEPHARVAANTVQHHWYTVDPTKGSAAAADEENHDDAEWKSGVIAETDDAVEVRLGTVVEKLQFDVKEFTVRPNGTPSPSRPATIVTPVG